MANDGIVEFHKITGFKNQELEDHDAVSSKLLLNNSCLIASLTIQGCLNYSEFKWRQIVFQFIDDFRGLLMDGEKKIIITFQKIANCMEKKMPLSEKDK